MLFYLYLQDLQTKLEAQDHRVSQEQQKEKKRFVKLQHEIEETVKECHDLTTRIKVCMNLEHFSLVQGTPILKGRDFRQKI